MTVSVSRLLSTLTAGGVLAGSLFFVTGAAEAAPRPPGGGTVPATCGQTVTAYPGDRVKVTPKLGVPFVQTATPGMGPVSMTISGLLCSVQVKVLKPVSAQMTRVAPPLGSVTTRLTEESDKVLGTESSEEQAAPSLVPAPRAAAPRAPVSSAPDRAPVSTLPSEAPLSTLPAGDLGAAAPQFAPTFADGLPSSFLSSGSSAPGARLDAGSLFGSAFPGMRAGAPTYLGYDPTSAVTTASQVQALPVDGLSEGVGLPAILAVLGLSGAAAFAVRRMVLGKSLVPAGLAGGAAAPSGPAPSLPASTEAPLEPAEQTALVDPVPSAAEQTALVDAVPSAAEQTAVVAEAPLADAEVTSVTPAFDDLDPAEVTATAPAVVEAEGADAPTPAEVTGVIDPVREHDGETTGVLTSTASH